MTTGKVSEKADQSKNHVTRFYFHDRDRIHHRFMVMPQYDSFSLMCTRMQSDYHIPKVHIFQTFFNMMFAKRTSYKMYEKF